MVRSGLSLQKDLQFYRIQYQQVFTPYLLVHSPKEVARHSRMSSFRSSCLYLSGWDWSSMLQSILECWTNILSHCNLYNKRSHAQMTAFLVECIWCKWFRLSILPPAFPSPASLLQSDTAGGKQWQETRHIMAIHQCSSPSHSSPSFVTIVMISQLLSSRSRC